MFSLSQVADQDPFRDLWRFTGRKYATMITPSVAFRFPSIRVFRPQSANCLERKDSPSRRVLGVEEFLEALYVKLVGGDGMSAILSPAWIMPKESTILELSLSALVKFSDPSVTSALLMLPSPSHLLNFPPEKTQYRYVTDPTSPGRKIAV